jgi:tetratricopeptide (TPR) repeat protein
MPGPRAVVIPFGVPADGRGLGLGLAALVHSFTHIDGQSVALAHLLAKPAGGPSSASPGSGDLGRMDLGPVEAFVPPHAWRDLAGAGNAPSDVLVVVTGSFEPPCDGKGMIQLLAFDARDGSTRAKTEAHVDSTRAGESLVDAFVEVWARVGGDLGMIRDLGDLGWEALESVLRAERCVLHDPARNGPHDRLAAMLHLGRAVGDAPDARFPVGRLATIALEAAMAPSPDAKLADAALRALTRASEDAPARIELLEASAAIHARIGNAAEAESRAFSAIAQAPDRMRLYAVLSEARRALGDLDGALDAVNAGLARANRDAGLVTERGVVLAERGDLLGAERAWREVLENEPIHPMAFANLSALALKRADMTLAASLVDQALVAPDSHPEILRRAIHLALVAEADGLARASRIGSLATALLEKMPFDAWASLMLARAHLQMGERERAMERLEQVQRLAPDSVYAAEAQRGFFALAEPGAAQELDAVARAGYSAALSDMVSLYARARRLAALHAVWLAWFVVGIIEQRRERWKSARDAFERAIGLAKGCTPAHVELVGTCIALGKPAAAVAHAERACALEGENPRTLGVRATALLAMGRPKEAETAIARALRLDPSDLANCALAERIRFKEAPNDGILLRWRRWLLGSKRWR